MAVALETVVKQLEDSGIVAPGKLENFVPPKAHPKSVEELVRELVKNNHLTKFQAQQVALGKAKALILGGYTIVDKIGAGGMGQVYKALHRRMERTVAIKMLPPATMKDPAAVARFDREVKAAAKLSHPNIVAAHDADEANGVHFLVMEYVPGTDLSSLVKKHGPLAGSQALNYVLQAARGLEYAHKKGVVHRDIKPANLLVDPEGTVKILDMGLARIETSGEAATQAELTGTGAVMGTVDYMAPEQALSTKTADARADIYSLGCTLYYLLTGQATYGGETLMAKLLAHREAPIPSLSDAFENAPAEVQALFARMIAKRVEDRPQTMSEVVAELERIIASGSAPDSLAPPAESTDTGLTKFFQNLPAGTTHKGSHTMAAGAAATASPTAARARPAAGSQRPSPAVLYGSLAAGGLSLVCIPLVLYFALSGGGPNPPSANPHSAIHTPQSAQPIDLFPHIDVAKGGKTGGKPGWSWTAHKQLVGIPYRSNIALPIDCSVPTAYVLEAHIDAPRPLNYDWPHFICFGLRSGDQRFAVQLDRKPDPKDANQAPLSGLITVGSKDTAENETTHRGQLLTDGKPHVVRIEVRPAGVSVVVDGQTVVDYRGDQRRLTTPRPIGTVDGVNISQSDLFLVVHDQLTINSLTLTPLPAPIAAGQPIDLFPHIDVAKGGLDNRGRPVWSWTGSRQSLVASAINSDRAILVDYQVPAAYVLEAKVTSNAGATAQRRVVIGLRSGEHRFALELNRPRGGMSDGDERWSGLARLDGQASPTNETGARGELFADGKSHTIRIEVRPDAIVVQFDGRTIVDYRGSHDRLSYPFASPTIIGVDISQSDLWLVVHDRTTFESLTLTPLSPGTATAPPAATAGNVSPGDYALLFDGDDVVNLVKPLQYTPDSFTFEGFVRVDAYVPRAWIFSPSGNSGLGLDMQEGRFWRLSHVQQPSGHFSIANPAEPIELGRRVHVAAVCAPNRFYLFLDGKRVAFSPPRSRQTVFPVSGVSKLGHLFRGLIDDVRISSQARYGDADFTPPLRHEKDADTLALWHFDEGAGDTLRDSSGNGYDGRILDARWVNAGGTPITSTPAAGNHALEFKGRSSYVATPVFYDGSHPLTVEAFVTPRNDNIQEAVFSDPASAQVSLIRTNKGTWQFFIAPSEKSGESSSVTPTAAGSRVHLAGVYDGMYVWLFVDGVPQPRKWIGAVKGVRLPLAIGTNLDVSSPVPVTRGPNEYAFTGQIDEVRISRTARYTANFTPKPRHEPDADTLALYHFDEGTGDIAEDSSPNKHHARIFGAKWTPVAASGSAVTQANVTPQPAGPAPAPKLFMHDATFPLWLKEVQVMPAEEQITAVSQKLVELNPGFDGQLHGRDGKGLPTISNGSVTLLHVKSPSAFNDLSPVQAFTGLRELVLSDCPNLTTLAGLHGMKLNRLMFRNSPVSDLSPLRGMPLEYCDCTSSQVSDLSPLESCQRLTTLRVKGAKVPPGSVAALQKALPNCKIEWDDPAKSAANPERRAAQWALAKGESVAVAEPGKTVLEGRAAADLPAGPFVVQKLNTKCQVESDDPE